MLILAGVSINAIVGENGVLSRAQYTSFMSEMSAVEEAVQLWKAGELIESKGQSNTAIPANGLCSREDLDKTERLGGEIGYYRAWSATGQPSTNILSSPSDFNIYERELVPFPAGIQDLYYLNNEALNLDKNKVYLIDAATSIVYSTTGITLNGVRCYSTHMAKAVMGNNVAPIFAEAEMSGGGDNIVYAGATYLKDKNGNYIDENGNIVSEENKVLNPNGFQFITSTGTNNLYKLYNNGDLYGKGLKGIGLQTEAIDSSLFAQLTIPDNISVAKVIVGSGGTLYVVDAQNDLWAWGSNQYNKLGLTQDQQVEYTGRDFVKLNVAGKGVYNVFDIGNSLFAVTTDNKLYAAGYNTRANLGVGHYNDVLGFTEVSGVENPKSIFNICGSSTDGTGLWYNDAPDNIEERTEEWCSYNKFYWSGKSRWGMGGINNNAIPNYTTFSRIWDGNDGDDIDHLIKYGFITDSPRILLLDGTYMQSGYGGSGAGAGAEGGGSSATFFTRTEATGIKFEKMWMAAATVILLDEDGYLWGVSSDNVSILGEPTRDWSLSKLENVPFDTANLKEVYVTGSNVFYLLNDGNVYASGSYSYMGLGKDWVTSISGIVCLTEGEYAVSFPKLKTVEDGEFEGGYLEKKMQYTNQAGNNVFIGEDNKLYLAGNSTLMFRNDILEQSWRVVAKNVKYFDPNCPAYIDTNGNLYVCGSNSDRLGLGHETNQKVNTFTEITDANIKGKAKKVEYNSNVLAVLTTDNKLYATGYYLYNANYYFPGWITTTENQITFIEVMSDVENFEYKGWSRIIQKTDGTVYGFGHWRGWNQSESGNNPIQVKTVTEQIKGLYPADRHSYILDVNGKLYASGDNGYSYMGMSSNTGDYKEFTGNINNEKVKDIAILNSYTHIILTEDGNLYGWGEKNRLGIGSTSGEYINEIQKLPLTNVESIVAGSGYFVATKRDGTVWGTGSNQYGVLGRWIGIDRTSPNSRYKTAFEWVECPELEI